MSDEWTKGWAKGKLQERESWISTLQKEIDLARSLGPGEGQFAVILTLEGILKEKGVNVISVYGDENE